MQTPTNSLLLPVETLNREFDGKLLFALHAVERGWKPIIGSRHDIHRNIASFPPSLYFSKSVRAGARTMYKIIPNVGHKICALDEEALVRLSNKIYLMKTDPLVAEATDMVFAWGHSDAEVYPQIDGMAGTPIVETGNPRADMMRPELRSFFADTIDDIRSRFGRFALFNSNFSIVNHFITGQARFRVGKWVAKDDADGLKGDLDRFKGALFEEFKKLVPRLAQAVAPNNLVIRPHPSENFQTWCDLTDHLPNVHVVHEGNVIPWLAAADVLIHCGCTSAVEAAIVGTPAIAYEPVMKDFWELDLPNDISQVMDDPDEACSEARRLLKLGGGGATRLDAARKSVIDAHIAALDGELACDRILDAIDDHPHLRDTRTTLPRRLGGIGMTAFRNLERTARTRRKSSPSSAAYAAHKFPGISLEDAENRRRRLSAALGRFDGIKLRQLRKDVFAVEKA